MSMKSFQTCLATAALVGCATGGVAKDYSARRMDDGNIRITVTAESSLPRGNQVISIRPQDRIEAAAARECNDAYEIVSATSKMNTNQAPIIMVTRTATVRCNPPASPSPTS